MQGSLITRLAGGAWHDAPDLAISLGCPEPQLASLAKELIALGVPLETRPQGLRLRPDYRPLAHSGIAAALGADAALALPTIELVDVTDSTNDDLLTRPAEAIHGAVRLAECQRLGRGRRGGRWLAPPGESLCLSLGWHMVAGPQALGPLGLVVALAAVGALARSTGRAVQVKWPNDLLLAGGKLGGILVELRPLAPERTALVIGLGLNTGRAAPLSATLGRRTAGLGDDGSAPDRNALVAALLDELVRDLRQFEAEGLAPFLARWAAADGLVGQTVAIADAEGATPTLVGTVLGLHESGGLKLATGRGEQTIHAGHVTFGEDALG